MIQFDDQGSNLIFLISLPRSGSTLLQRILGGHPDIATLAEPWVMLHPLYALKRAGIETEYDAVLAREALDDFLGQIDGGETAYVEGVRRFAGDLYARALARQGKRLFLDKTPRYYRIIPELRQVFPRAKFIILLRNPRFTRLTLNALQVRLTVETRDYQKTALDSNTGLRVAKMLSYTTESLIQMPAVNP